MLILRVVEIFNPHKEVEKKKKLKNILMMIKKLRN